MILSKLHIYKFTFVFKVKSPITLPYYAGSALRGVFGHALYKISPSSKIKIKNNQIDYNKICPFAHLFNKITPTTIGTETANFVVSPLNFGKNLILDKGEYLKFDFIIFNETIEFIDAFILAWENALNKGVGFGQGKAELYEILLNDEFFDEQTSSPLVINFHEPPHNIELEFITPLRVKNNNMIMAGDNFSFTQLIKSLASRYNNLTHTQDIRYTEIIKDSKSINTTNNLEIKKWIRKSNRQRQTMEFLGAMGKVKIDLDHGNQLIYNLLKIGEQIHTGKSTCFGLGKYIINTNS